eukprot:EG_transcript_8668
MYLHPFDIVCVVLYFGTVMGISVWVYIAQKRAPASVESFFLADRCMPWWAVALSLFTSNIGSEHLIGLSQTGAARGIAGGFFEWGAMLSLVVLGWGFIPVYIRQKVVTMPGYLEQRFDRRCRLLYAVLSLLLYITMKIAVALLSGAVVFRTILGWDLYPSSVVLIALTGLYSALGGMRAVVYTEVLQSSVLLAGGLGLLAAILRIFGGWGGLKAHLPPNDLALLLPTDDPDFPWTGLLFGFPIISTWYWCADQVMVQRVLAARGVAAAQGGCAGCGLLKALTPFMFVVPGIAARELFPEVRADTNLAFPLLVTRLIPPGLQGLMVAAMLAALMSSLAAVMNSCGTIVAMDLYAPFRPNVSNAELVMAGRIGTFVVAGLGLLWLPLIPFFSAGLWVYVQSITSYLSPGIAATFLGGIFWSRANSHGAFASLCTGLVLAVARIVVEPLYRIGSIPPFTFLGALASSNFLHVCIIYFAICMLALVSVSLMTPAPPPEKLAGLTWQHRHAVVDSAPVGPPEGLPMEDSFIEVPLDSTISEQLLDPGQARLRRPDIQP